MMMSSCEEKEKRNFGHVVTENIPLDFVIQSILSITKRKKKMEMGCKV